MSLNWAMLDPSTSEPIPLPDEEFILSLQGAEFTLYIPDAPPPSTGEASAGGAGGQAKKMIGLGRVWTTDHRVIFVPAKAKDTPYTSLSIPLANVISSSFQQPIFGANHIVMQIAPSSGGGLTQGTKAEVRFKDRGVFEFVKVLEAARERAIAKERDRGEEALPLYSAPPSVGTSNAVPQAGPSAPPPAPSGMAPPEDAPPGYEL